ncbi:hypothetical protein [Marinomonas primoryensis]|uniref:hypothetical protein n=1 Tax=Marinomonas primoryensis TaxID=178399 RepID=UPI0013AF5422|nr:hypothetical protein [Marinomonas primoryensis]
MIKNLSNKTQMFIEQAVSVHGDKYSYNAVDYKTTKLKVNIFCPEHGYFEQSPEKHLAGQGCKSCGKAKQQKTTDEVIAEFQSVHGNRYDYAVSSIFAGTSPPSAGIGE